MREGGRKEMDAKRKERERGEDGRIGLRREGKGTEWKERGTKGKEDKGK